MSRKESVDPYEEFSEFYDLYVGDRLDDLPFYLEFAKSAQTPVLEIGAGSGRLTVPLAREGVSVVAVDISPAMLAILRSRLQQEPNAVRRRIEIVQADACRLDLGRHFDLVIVPFYTFNYFLTPETQTNVLNRMASHLAKASQLLMDVFVPLRLLENCPVDPVLKVDRIDPATGRTVRGWNMYSFDPEHQIEHRRHIFEIVQPDGSAQKREFTTTRRYWFREQLDELLQRHGFVVERICGGYAGKLADERSEQIMYILRRQSDTPSDA